LAPESEGLIKLAELERGLGRVDEALKCCRRALKRRPDDAVAHRMMARILTEEGRLDEAAPAWERATALDPAPIEVQITKAYALLAAGLFDDAIAEFRSVIEIDPNQWRPYNAIVSAKRVTEQDRELLVQMQRIVDDPSSSAQDRFNLHYALGKAHDNLREYETAMRHFDEANRVKLTETDLIPPYSEDELREEADDKIKTFTRSLMRQVHETASPSDRPIFVVGMMRSGTTLAEQILSCHRDIGGAGEQPYWREWETQVVNWKTGESKPERLRAMADQFCALLETIAPGCRFVVDKNPANSMIVGLLHLAFPNARIIHTIRNPVDTALSIWMTPMQTVAPFVCDREHIVFAYRQYQRLADHWRSLIPADRYLEVRYEDLVSEREPITRKMIDFCNLEWDDACLHPESNPRSVRTPSFWQVRQPIYATSVERWRRYEPWLGVFRELKE
jgi:tetratricopeptide (TPR) repeat protein